MKYLLKALLAIFVLKSLVILILFILAFVAWLSGGGNVLFPGLGLVVAMSVIVFLLFIMLIISVSITALLARVVFKGLP